jgi:hypothetical protein
MANVHLFLAESDLSHWLGIAFVAFFFFIVPIVKAAREARQKQRLEEQRGSMGTPQPTARRMPETDMDEARRKWEALLRGEEFEPATPPAPVVRMPEPAQQPTAESPAPTLAQQLASLDPEGRSGSAETSFDEERVAQTQNEALAREEKQRRDDFIFAQREDAPVRADVASDIGRDTPPERKLVAADLQRRRSVLGSGTGMATRAGLRNAILASEIFGQPVGLRDGSGGTGPIGDRS